MDRQRVNVGGLARWDLTVAGDEVVVSRGSSLLFEDNVVIG